MNMFWTSCDHECVSLSSRGVFGIQCESLNGFLYRMAQYGVQQSTVYPKQHTKEGKNKLFPYVCSLMHVEEISICLQKLITIDNHFCWFGQSDVTGPTLSCLFRLSIQGKLCWVFSTLISHFKQESSVSHARWKAACRIHEYHDYFDFHEPEQDQHN